MSDFPSNFSVGLDIENSRRFDLHTGGPDQRFLSAVFTEHELAYCFSKGEPAPHLAVRFAAKEAVIKALTGLVRPVPPPNQIEILLDENNKPYIRFAGDTLKYIQVKISVSHCQDLASAVAFVVMMDDR